ncbi:MAG: mandelate racemase, partial [Solirubrobacterales bacterium]|nr:mandelate racemase [Solirubrobacterales bacterium]
MTIGRLAADVGLSKAGVLGHFGSKQELQLATLSFAADTHYHHLVDDVIIGGKMVYRDGSIAVPDGPGLGVELDRDRMERYAEYYRDVGNYVYDRDPGRPGWYPLI